MRFLLTGLALAFLGCGSPCGDPFYDGAGSDEAWRTMQDGEARATGNDAKAVKVFSPTQGQQLRAAAGPPTFNWTSPLVASLPNLPQRAAASRPPSLFSGIGELLYGSAWAHLPPVTGPVHLLRITAPNRACPLEVLTTKNEWIPNEAAWAQLKTFTTAPVSLDVFSAYLRENRITEGEYHFTKPLTFTVSK